MKPAQVKPVIDLDVVQNHPVIAGTRSLSAWICEAEVSPREPSRA